MDFANPSFWFDVGQSVVILLLWLRKPGEDAGHRITALDSRVNVIQERLAHVPQNTDIAELEGSLKATIAQFEAIRDQVNITRQTVQRIEDFLRENK